MALTPTEEAKYALDYGVSRSDLSLGAQIEYDRLVAEGYAKPPGSPEIPPEQPPGGPGQPPWSNPQGPKPFWRRPPFLMVVPPLILVIIIVIAAVATSHPSIPAASPSSSAEASQAIGSPSSSSSGSPSGSPSASPTPAKLTASQLAAQKAAAERARAIHQARIARENTLISATQWNEVIQNPDNYEGDIYTISGTVTEYNINSNTLATQESAALVAVDGNGNYFVVEAPASVLGNAQPGDTFTAKVTVLGAEEAENTVYGGTSEVPDFDASTFTITG